MAGITSLWTCVAHSLLMLVAVKFPEARCENVFCYEDNFKAECPPGEVIMITNAQFGRMELNRCVASDHGHLGCRADSVMYLDYLCSGKRTCELSVFEHKNELAAGGGGFKGCPPDLVSYLRAEYKCVAATQSPDGSTCYREDIIPVTSSHGVLSSAVSAATKEGSSRCPYHFQLEPGRKLNLTFYNFGSYERETGRVAGCPPVFRVWSGPAAAGGEGSPHDVTLCDDVGRGKSVGVFPAPVRLEVVLVNGVTANGNFLLQYNVTGCANLAPRPNTVVVREDDQLTVTCNTTDEVRSLVCQTDHWSGEVQQCPDRKSSGVWGNMGRLGDNEFPIGILIIVAIGVALGVFLGGVMLVVASMHMKKKQEQKRQKLIYMSAHHPDMSPLEGGMDIQQHHRVNTLHRDCAQCTIERASKHRQQSPRVKTSTYYPPPGGIDGSIKDYSLFEKNSLQDPVIGGGNSGSSNVTAVKPVPGITSSNKSLQSGGKTHTYELPAGNRFT